MGLKHVFFLIESDQIPYSNFSDYRFLKKVIDEKNSGKTDLRYLEIHDDVIRYMYETLAWVPCIVISRNKSERVIGLNPNSIQVVDREGSFLLCDILELWQRLLTSATDKFKIRRGYYIRDTDENFVGDHWEYIVSRDELIQSLQMLVEFTNSVAVGNTYILYVGI